MFGSFPPSPLVVSASKVYSGRSRHCLRNHYTRRPLGGTIATKDSAVVVKQQQVCFAVFVARITIDRVLAAVLVSVWTLVPVLVRCRWSRGRLYANVLLRICWICRNPHSALVAYHEFLSILGLDHKATPLVVNSPIDWYDAAQWTG